MEKNELFEQPAPYTNGQATTQPQPAQQQERPQIYLALDGEQPQYVGPFGNLDSASEFAHNLDLPTSVQFTEEIPEESIVINPEEYQTQLNGQRSVLAVLQAQFLSAAMGIDLNQEELRYEMAVSNSPNSIVIQRQGNVLTISQSLADGICDDYIKLTFAVGNDHSLTLTDTWIKDNPRYDPLSAIGWLEHWKKHTQFRNYQSPYEEDYDRDELTPWETERVAPTGKRREKTGMGGENDDLISADTIAVLDFHDSLDPAARQWLMDQFEHVAHSGIGEEIQSQDAVAARTALEKLRALPGEIRDQAICNSALALVKAHGKLDTSQGTPEMVYQAERYTIRLRSSKEGALGLDDLKQMDLCTVEDTSGKAILSFKHKDMRGIEVLHNSCTLEQQYDLARAGVYLARIRASEAVQTTGSHLKVIGEQLGSLSRGLANFAPQGTREKFAEFQQYQVAAMAQVLASSKSKIASIGQERFEVSRDNGETTIGLKGIGTVFRQMGKTISTRMATQDTQVFLEAGKKLSQTLAATRSGNREQSQIEIDR